MQTTHNQTFTEFIKEAKLSQADLARATNFTQSQLSRYMRGITKNPGADFIMRIVTVTGISQNWWFHRVGPKKLADCDIKKTENKATYLAELEKRHMNILEKYAVLAGENLENIKTKNNG